MWNLVIEKKINSKQAIKKHFRDVKYHALMELFSKINHGYPLTSIPTVPENFFARIHGVKKGERFEHKDGR